MSLTDELALERTHKRMIREPQQLDSLAGIPHYDLDHVVHGAAVRDEAPKSRVVGLTQIFCIPRSRRSRTLTH